MKDEALLDALLEIRGLVADGRQDSCGICCQLPLLDQDPAQLRGLFRRWPEFSGNEHYPVPHPTNCPRSAYYDYGYSEFRSEARAREYGWGNNPYGQARRRLLDFCLEELQRELAPPAGIFEPVNVQRARRGGASFQMRVPSYIGTDANYEAIKAETPTTCCPCGQVPVCHGLRSCGKSDA